jgi:hypothetical protein
MGQKSRAAREKRVAREQEPSPSPSPSPVVPAAAVVPDVFDNPAADLAIKQLTPEQREHYREVGEAMYGRVNFPDAKVLDSMPPPMAECAAYIADGLRSGLLPSALSEDEVHVAVEAWGDKWWEQFGFTAEEAGGDREMRKER